MFAHTWCVVISYSYYYKYYINALDHVSGSISILPPFTKREKYHLKLRILLLLTAGIEPGPPSQKASALSFTPLSLDTAEKS